MQSAADRYSFEVVLKGRDFHTQLIKPSEVASIIVSIEQMMRAIVARDNPTLDIDEDELVIGLSSVTQTDLVSTFVTPYEDEVSRALDLTAAAIVTENFAPLPVESIRAIKTIRAFNKISQTVTEFRERNGRYASLAELTPKTRIRVQAYVLKNQTTMYGTLARVGGYDPPRAYMRFLDGTKFSCRVNDPQLAKEMGSHLYELIGVRGVAQWDVHNLLLHDFRIEELLPYKETTITEAMRGLRDSIGEYYDRIEDIQSYIANQRDIDEYE